MSIPNIFIPTIRPELAKVANSGIENKGVIVDGNGIKCYSQMINQILFNAETEIVIICHDRARPSMSDVHKIIELIDSGFGFAGMYCFGFYGIHKDAIRRIGPLDERYIKGGWEDSDYMRRFKEADMAYYESREVKYIDVESTLFTDNSVASEHFKRKWIDTHDLCARLLPDEEYKQYNFGKSTGKVFKKWNESVLCLESEYFIDVPFRRE